MKLVHFPFEIQISATKTFGTVATKLTKNGKGHLGSQGLVCLCGTTEEKWWCNMAAPVKKDLFLI